MFTPKVNHFKGISIQNTSHLNPNTIVVDVQLLLMLLQSISDGINIYLLANASKLTIQGTCMLCSKIFNQILSKRWYFMLMCLLFILWQFTRGYLTL